MLSERRRIILALGTAQTLGWGSTFYLPAILAAPMAADLGLPLGGIYAAFSAALVVSALLGPMAGRRIDRFGGREVLSASSLVFAAGLGMLGLAQGATMLGAAWLLIGIGMAIGLYEAAFATLAAIYGRRARGAITGITLIAGLASTICWPISAWLEAEIGWRGTCFFWLGAHLVLGLPLNLLLIPRAGAARNAAAAPESPAPVVAAAPPPPGQHERMMVLLGLAFTVIWFTSTAMGAHLPRLLQEAGVSPVAAIAAAALVGPAQVAGRMLEFGVLQRFHPLLSARMAAMAHPVAAASLVAFGAPVAAIFALVHGAGNGILTIAKGTLPLAIFGPEGYGHRQGLLTVPARFGQAAAPFLFALLIERMGASALMVSGALGLVAFACMMAIPSGAIGGAERG